MKGESRRCESVFNSSTTHPVNLMGVDGTWRRSCVMLDVSQSGAKLEIEGSPDVLRAREFFLLLSSTGLAFRRCELVWVDGTQVGVKFIRARQGQEDTQSRFRIGEQGSLQDRNSWRLGRYALGNHAGSCDSRHFCEAGRRSVRAGAQACRDVRIAAGAERPAQQHRRARHQGGPARHSEHLRAQADSSMA